MPASHMHSIAVPDEDFGSGICQEEHIELEDHSWLCRSQAKCEGRVSSHRPQHCGNLAVVCFNSETDLAKWLTSIQIPYPLETQIIVNLPS